jgi:hypothetical protein
LKLRGTSERLVTGPLVELAGPIDDVGSVDLLGPLTRLDFLKADRHGIFIAAEAHHNGFRHALGEPLLLLLRFAGPELNNKRAASLCLPHRWY